MEFELGHKIFYAQCFEDDEGYVKTGGFCMEMGLRGGVIGCGCGWEGCSWDAAFGAFGL